MHNDSPAQNFFIFQACEDVHTMLLNRGRLISRACVVLHRCPSVLLLKVFVPEVPQRIFMARLALMNVNTTLVPASSFASWIDIIKGPCQ